MTDSAPHASDPVAYRTCPICEAACGLRIVQRSESTDIAGDKDDPLSGGYVCPKGIAIGRMDADTDRVRRPLIRDRRTGARREASWEEAFTLIDAGLGPLLRSGDADAVGFYMGHGMSHSAATVYVGTLLEATGTRNVYTSSTVDQAPKQIAASLMFGHPMTIAIPDIDHTDYLMVLGANPLESNGSLFTAPGLPLRLRQLRQRGGRLVVVDPRRTRTAKIADEHIALRPTTDAYFLAGIVQVLLERNIADLGRLGPYLQGLEILRKSFEDFTPEAVAPRCGVAPEVIERLALEIAMAPSAAVYGRLGTTTHEFGTIASWMVDLINILTGNLDRRGGVMFPLAAVGQHNSRLVDTQVPHQVFGPLTRVRGAPSINIMRGYERPSVTIADEMEVAGTGQLRGLITIGSNPILSRPNPNRLRAALENLEFMVSIDPYINETTRHADVILPPPPILSSEHYPTLFMQWSTRNFTKWSSPAFSLGPDELSNSEIFLRLGNVLLGRGPHADPWRLDQQMIEAMVAEATSNPHHPLFESDQFDILSKLEKRTGSARVIDFLLRAGPYGDHFGSNHEGLSLDALEASPHGIDLGPLHPRLPGVLATRSQKIELAPALLVDDLRRLRARLQDSTGGLLLVGRRTINSCNSKMNNIGWLRRGPDKCTLHVHPDDAQSAGIEDGADAWVNSEHGRVRIPVELTEDIRSGVVSIPHGFGNEAVDTRMTEAASRPGVNVNELIPDGEYEPLSGNAILSGIRVWLEPASGKDSRWNLKRQSPYSATAITSSSESRV